MTGFEIWSVILGLGLLTYFLRAAFIVFLGDGELPEILLRHLRYVSVAIIPGMIAVLVVYPASMDQETNAIWLGASFAAIFMGIKSKNPLMIMLAGLSVYIFLTWLL